MKIQRLTQDYIFKDFDCGNEDLNDFLFHDSKRYLKSRLAVTYIIESEDTTIGYFSLSNDKLTIREVDKSSWRRIKQLFSHSKHRCDYPAVKVGRLAPNQHNSINTKFHMATPIAPTPELTGKAARKFMEEMAQNKKATPEEKARIKANAQWVMERMDFDF